jgi:hypothetical protein
MAKSINGTDSKAKEVARKGVSERADLDFTTLKMNLQRGVLMVWLKMLWSSDNYAQLLRPRRARRIARLYGGAALCGLLTPVNFKKMRKAADRFVFNEDYECESKEEAKDLADALNDAPETATVSWDDFLAWAKRTGHTIFRYYE